MRGHWSTTAALGLALLLAAPAAFAADPVKKACLADCKAAGTACKDAAGSARDQAQATCAADPATEKECRAAAKGVYIQSATVSSTMGPGVKVETAGYR